MSGGGMNKLQSALKNPAKLPPPLPAPDAYTSSGGRAGELGRRITAMDRASDFLTKRRAEDESAARKLLG
jgi:hypothetical protein